MPLPQCSSRLLLPMLGLVMLPALHGAEVTLAPHYDLAKKPGAASDVVRMRGFGGVAGDGLGRVIRTGDLNGDGRDDLVVATDTGKIHVWFGSSNLSSELDAQGLSGRRPDTTLSGFAALRALAVGDVNGDGNADIIVGLTPTANGHGNVAIVFGRTSYPAALDLQSAHAFTGANVLMDPVSVDDGLALDGALTLADMNGDGRMDILVGAPFAKKFGSEGPAVGAVHIVFGTETFPASLPLAAYGSSTTLRGNADGDGLAEGGAMHVADVNGDGKKDLIVAAPGANGPQGQPDAGRVYVLFGRTHLHSYSFLTVNSDANVTIFGGDVGEALTRGGQITSGDVNGDGIRDLFFSAPLARANGSNSGKAYVLLGRSVFPTVISLFTGNNSSGADMVINGYFPPYHLAADGALTAADINGDGADDILVSTPEASGPVAGPEAGRVYVVLGRKSPAILPPVVELAPVTPHAKADVMIQGARHSDHLTGGGALITGDVDGDGYNDIILGSDSTLSTQYGTRLGAGRAYIIFGRATFPPLLDLRQENGPSAGANVHLHGASEYDALTQDGAMVLADLNGDGNPDLILGAPKADGPADAREDAGEIYVMQGVSRAEIALLDPKGVEVIANMDSFPVVNLGKVGLGAPVTFTFTVKNTGRQELSGLDAYLLGANHAMFELPPSALPQALEPKTSAPLDLLFTPNSLGLKEVKLELFSSDRDEGQMVVRLQVEVIKAVPPLVKTLTATAEVTTATVGGLVNPKGYARRVSFDYGLTTSYGETVAAGSVPADFPADQQVPATLLGLLPHTRYHYRIRAASNEGRAAGGDSTFVTLNRQPAVSDDAYQVIDGSVVPLHVLANDDDPDGDEVTIASFTQPKTAGIKAGSLLRSGRTLIFTAPANFSTLTAGGGATFTYVVKDGFGGSAVATVTLTSGTANLEPSDLHFTAAGGMQYFSFATDALWSINESAHWIMTETESYGPYTNSALITTLPNLSTTARQALIHVAGKPLTVHQEGAIKPIIALPEGEVPPAWVSGYYELAILTENAPVTYSVAGLPPGLAIDQTTGLISGSPIKAGAYDVTVNARNAAGTADAPLEFVIDVSPLHADLPGTYLGFITQTDFSPGGIGARLELTVNASGAVSGKIVSGLTAKSFTGRLNVDVSDDNPPTLTVPLPTEAVPSSVLELTFDPAQQSLSGQLADNRQGMVTGWRQGWHQARPASAYAGLHTFRLFDPHFFADMPAGYGHGSFTVNERTGAVTVTGKLPDNSVFSTTGFIGQQGQVLIHQPLYHKKGPFGTALGQGPPRGAFTGVLMVEAGETPADNVIRGLNSFEPHWLKPVIPSAEKDTVYAGGIGGLVVQVDGGAYPVPGPGEVVMKLGNEDANAFIHFLLGGLEGDLTYGLSLRNPSATGLTQTATPLAPVQNQLTLSISKAATGAFSGAFTLAGTTASTNRKVSYEGQIVKIGTDIKGYGFFLLPELPDAEGETVKNTPKWSGRVLLEGGQVP